MQDLKFKPRSPKKNKKISEFAHFTFFCEEDTKMVLRFFAFSIIKNAK